ncbi:response regulator [Pelagicoccus sp. SDUM812003]|uniref:response regulator n=1 Tax=Pelagicoccus sp. SDUM812003 TaxID=3041267 RepID=UPI00280FEA43|nr:response regulator [Pelagicoccus sp. SDUM812003]MDQ8205497.1 response regulator [Pelagicoccus sp. SDUM812003]
MPNAFKKLTGLFKRNPASKPGASPSRRNIGEMQHRLHLLEQAVEQSPVSIVITNQDGVIEYVNRAFEQRTGYSACEAIGRTPSILGAGTHSKSFYKKLWRTITEGKVWTGQFNNRKKSGELYWEQATIAPILNESGQIANYVAVKEDITVQRRKDQELRAAYAKVRAAEDAKDAFLNTMSHEFRTPLNAIIGLSSVLKEESSDPTAKAWLSDINSSGEQLLKLNEDLFELTQCYSETDEPFIEDVDILRLVEEVLEQSAEAAQAKGLELRYDLSPELPATIACDPVRVKKILIHLLSNSLKFTSKGYAKLKLDHQILESGRARIRFSVIDSGMGISSDDLDLIFDPFYRVNGDSSNGFQGAGVGLAICRHLAASMQSSIQVKSIPDLGSEFSFAIDSLPVKDAPSVFAQFRSRELMNHLICTTLQESSLAQHLCIAAKVCSFNLESVDSEHILQTLKNGGIDLAFIDPDQLDADTFAELQSSSLPIYWVNERELPLPFSEAMRLIGQIPKQEPEQAPNPVDSPAARNEASAHKAALLPADSLRILVVDDISLNLKVATMTLKHLGFAADTANGGREFIQKVCQNQYDLVLLDLLMPDINGLDAFKELRDHPPSHGLPKIVALTANTQECTREQCLTAGMDGFMTKPIDRSKIKRCLETHFQSADGSEPESETEPALASHDASASPTQQTPSQHASDSMIEVESTTEPELLDQSHIDEICFEMDRDSAIAVLTECYQSLARDFENQLREIEQACAQKDVEALIPVVHGLKGAVASLGWQRSAQLYERSLKALRANRFSDYETFPQAISKDFQLSSAAMKHYMGCL